MTLYEATSDLDDGQCGGAASLSRLSLATRGAEYNQQVINESVACKFKD